MEFSEDDLVKPNYNKDDDVYRSNDKLFETRGYYLKWGFKRIGEISKDEYINKGEVFMNLIILKKGLIGNLCRYIGKVIRDGVVWECIKCGIEEMCKVVFNTTNNENSSNNSSGLTSQELEILHGINKNK